MGNVARGIVMAAELFAVAAIFGILVGMIVFLAFAGLDALGNGSTH